MECQQNKMVDRIWPTQMTKISGQPHPFGTFVNNFLRKQKEKKK